MTVVRMRDIATTTIGPRVGVQIGRLPTGATSETVVPIPIDPRRPTAVIDMVVMEVVTPIGLNLVAAAGDTKARRCTILGRLRVTSPSVQTVLQARPASLPHPHNLVTSAEVEVIDAAALEVEVVVAAEDFHQCISQSVTFLPTP